MKPTMSKDGELRFNCTIKTRISRLDIAHAIMWKLIRDEPQDGLKTRRDVWEAVKDAVEAEGRNLWASVDDATAEDALWAFKQVDRLFPELSPVKQPSSHP